MKKIFTIFNVLLFTLISVICSNDLLATSYPIAPFSDTLFVISAGFNTVSAKERAGLIQKRILRTVAEKANPDSINIIMIDSIPEICIADAMIMSITPDDTIGTGKTQWELAQAHKTTIVKAIKAENSEKNIFNLIVKIAIGLLTVIVLLLFLKYNGRVFDKLRAYYDKFSVAHIKPISFNNYELVSVNAQNILIHKFITILKLATILIISYIALPIFFSLIPGAESVADSLINLILSPAEKMLSSFINYFPNLITIIVILVIFRYINLLVKFLADEVANENLKIAGFFPDWALPTYNIVKFVLIALMFITIFPYLPGSNSPIFQGVSVFIGVLFSLGSSNAIGNIVAGLVITYMRPFRIGDRIKIADVVGNVISKDLLVTRVRTPHNEIITIPNQSILNGNTINYTHLCAKEGLIIHSGVTIGYDVYWDIVHKLLINAAKATKGIDTSKAPFVLQTSLDDFYVAYEINAYVKSTEGIAGVYSELHKNIQEEFMKAKVEIMSPHYRANRDGSDITIPTK